MKATIVLALAAFAAAQTTTAPAMSDCIQKCLDDAVNDVCKGMTDQIGCACQNQDMIQRNVAGCQVTSGCKDSAMALQNILMDGVSRCAAVSGTSTSNGSMNQTMTMTSDMTSETNTESESESETGTTMTPTTTAAPTTTSSQTSSTSNAAVAGAPAGALAALLAAAFAL